MHALIQSRFARHVRRWAAARPRAFLSVVAVAAAAEVGVALAGVWMTVAVLSGLPDDEAVHRLGEMPRATVVLDAHDAHAFQVFDERRIEVPLDQVSPHLIDAIVALEDQRFYDHDGIDVVRIGGAFVANLRQGRRAQGASTLTQQLARQSFLSPAKTYTRKLQEMLLAIRIEREYTKDEILAMYLNKVYFGAGLYGAEAASLGYFGKHAKDLTVAEAALLAGLVKAPSSYAPTTNLDRALERRALVLDVMREAAVIDEPTHAAAVQARVRLKDGLGREGGWGEYFREEVRLALIERFGRDRVYQGGLTVYTTLDPAMQKAAEAAVSRTLRDLDRRRGARGRQDGDPLQGALVALDPATGHVRALVGGRRFADSTFNRATQARRQPGSAFKPFVYAAALEAGFTPATLIERLDDPIQLASGAWTPDDTRLDRTEMTMREAIKVSSNRAAVRMLQDLGVQRAVTTAARLGIDGMPAVPSLALGAGEVTLQAMTAAYGVFAAGGVRHEPVLIRRVEDASGEVIYEAPDSATRVIRETTAFQMASMLTDVVDGGTGWRVRQSGFRLPAAGKTGTTNSYHDAWFVGFTPRLVTGVWVGFDQPRPILRGGHAGDVAVPLWTAFMKAATKGHRAEWLTPPDGLTRVAVCRLSGQRAGVGCESVFVTDEDGAFVERSYVYPEYFVHGTAPEDECLLHRPNSFWRRISGWFRQ